MIQKQPLNEIPLFQAAKWLKLPILLSEQEMEEALSLLPKWIVPLGGVAEEGKELLSKEEFLSLYASYVAAIDEGMKRPPIDKRLTAAFVDNLDYVRRASVSSGVLVRLIGPSIQVQPYMLHYSSATGKLIDSSYSQDSFAWGLVFSSPQLIQNPITREIEKFNDPHFKNLQKWARQATRPTPFLIEGKIKNFPARIGKTRKIPICLPQK